MIAASLQPDGQTSGLHGPEVPHHHLQVAVGFAEHRDELGLLLRTHEGLQVRRELMEAAGVVLQSVDQIGSHSARVALALLHQSATLRRCRRGRELGAHHQRAQAWESRTRRGCAAPGVPAFIGDPVAGGAGAVEEAGEIEGAGELGILEGAGVVGVPDGAGVVGIPDGAGVVGAPEEAGVAAGSSFFTQPNARRTGSLDDNRRI